MKTCSNMCQSCIDLIELDSFDAKLHRTLMSTYRAGLRDNQRAVDSEKERRAGLRAVYACEFCGHKFQSLTGSPRRYCHPHRTPASRKTN